METKKQDDQLIALLLSLREKDMTTYLHSIQSATLIKMMARELQLPDSEALVRSALLHDIGKTLLPSEILQKQTMLRIDEWEQIRKHPLYSVELLTKHYTESELDYDLVSYHHENVDGTGYPYGKGIDEIPLQARLFRIIDSYEAMTGQRPYRKSITKEQAIEELNRYRDIYYDSSLLDSFISAITKNDL
ncbi:HD domain-containing protein [Bacillus sp. BGMRC 2118]|nr:HD domain-containing protein [Bacillus sp. BGMRC 2118]